MSYIIVNVDGESFAGDLKRLNDMFPDDFLPLKPRQLRDGHWWLIYNGTQAVGFAGAVPFIPFPKAGYFKRVAILPGHRGQGLQKQLIERSVARAKQATDWTHMFSSCHFENYASANSFINAGWKLCEVERPWEPESLFWVKKI
jgi:GNAT superfamily N-acetyltransferase